MTSMEYQRVRISDESVPDYPPHPSDGVEDATSLSLGEIQQPVSEWGIVCLLLQHTSSTFTDGCYNFAVFLFLIEIFPTTLVPPSLVGLFMTGTSLILSGHVGGLVDNLPRLVFIRRAVGCQKALQAVVYCLFLVLFGPVINLARSALDGQVSIMQGLAVWGLLGLIVAASSMLALANTGLTVCVERDWVTTITQGDDPMLTRLNTSMRRIDLLSKLCSPLIVSILTTTFGYTMTTASLLGLASVTAVTETLWVAVVYSKFPALAVKEDRHGNDRPSLSWYDRMASELEDWREFVRMPIFASSVAIAAIFMTTLSYDGTFIAYVKAARGWDDKFIAGMRGVSVLTGILGTLVMPVLERHLGLERAGAWSIWFEVICLCPTVISFFYGTGAYGQHGPAWNSVLLFGGIALSRIGLWSFDLCQLKELQLALNDHPRRNRMTALQMALQSAFDLLKYVVTLSAATPSRFKWTALASWIAVIGGALVYAVYLRSVRGHLFHFHWKSC